MMAEGMRGFTGLHNSPGGDRLTMKRWVVPVAALLFLALPATALADIRFRGKSGQGRLVTMRTSDDRVLERFGIRWQARCQDPGYVYTTRTFFIPPFDSVTAERFVDAGVNRGRLADGLRSVINIRLAGNRTSIMRWRGIFRVRVRVFRGSREIDRCYLRTRWRVRNVNR